MLETLSDWRLCLALNTSLICWILMIFARRRRLATRGFTALASALTLLIGILMLDAWQLSMNGPPAAKPSGVVEVISGDETDLDAGQPPSSAMIREPQTVVPQAVEPQIVVAPATTDSGPVSTAVANHTETRNVPQIETSAEVYQEDEASASDLPIDEATDVIVAESQFPLATEVVAVERNATSNSVPDDSPEQLKLPFTASMGQDMAGSQSATDDSTSSRDVAAAPAATELLSPDITETKSIPEVRPDEPEQPRRQAILKTELWNKIVASIQEQVRSAGGKTGAVTVSLKWSNQNDLDLHVVTGDGEEIYFSRKESRCGGVLDVDRNVSPTTDEPVENIRWLDASKVRGPLRIFVVHYKNHGLPGCADPTEFFIRVNVGATERLFQGSVTWDPVLKNVPVAEIELP